MLIGAGRSVIILADRTATHFGTLDVVFVAEMELNVSEKQVCISLEPLAVKLLPFNVSLLSVFNQPYSSINAIAIIKKSKQTNMERQATAVIT